MNQASNTADRVFVPPPRRGPLIGAYAAMLIATMLGPLVTMSDLPGMGEQSYIRQIAYVLILGTALFSLRLTKDVTRLLSLPWPLLLVLGWCWLSLGWAISFPTALSRLILTCIVLWTIFTSVRFIGYERALLILRMILAVFVVVNFAAVLLAPDFAIHHLNEPDDKTLVGDWRGIMMHKNMLGAFAAITIIAFAFDCEKFPVIVRIAIAAAAAVLLGQSGSKTSFGMVVGALAIGFIFMNYDARYRPAAVAGVFLVTLAAVLATYVYADPLKANFTDPKAFTGRPLIWKAVSDYWLDNPMTGAGFGSFWGIGTDSPIYHYGTGWVTTVFTAHNGYLELLAQIGLPGLLLTLFAVLVWPLAKLLGANDISGPRASLLIALFLFCIGHNATESSLLDRDVLVNVVLMIVIAAIAWAEPSREARSFSFDVSRRFA